MTDMIEKIARAIEPELSNQEMLMTDPLTLRRLMAMRCAKAALTALEGVRLVPVVWGDQERDRLEQKFVTTSEKHGHYETLFAVAAEGIRIFDYGRSKRDTGSYRFKKHWGFEPEALHYEHRLVRATEPPNVNPTNPKYRMFIALWRKLPLDIANRVGPFISKDLG